MAGVTKGALGKCCLSLEANAGRRSMKTLDIFNLTGRTALVTGGTRGIGGAIAEGLAGAGARVITVARGEGATIRADLSKPGEAHRVMAEAGPVDILVNNAGVD